MREASAEVCVSDPYREDDHGDALAVEPALHGEDRIIMEYVGEKRGFGEYDLSSEQDRVREPLQDLRSDAGNLVHHVGAEGRIPRGVIPVAAHIMDVAIKVFLHLGLHMGDRKSTRLNSSHQL